MPTSGSILGNPVRRREDPGILTGRTQYFDDLQIPGMAHVAFVRSTIAHAVIEGIDTSDAISMPGVVAVYTADDLDLPDHHGFMMLPPTMNRPPLARGRVRYVGDIVAVVVAETKAQDLIDAHQYVLDEVSARQRSLSRRSAPRSRGASARSRRSSHGGSARPASPR